MEITIETTDVQLMVGLIDWLNVQKAEPGSTLIHVCEPEDGPVIPLMESQSQTFKSL